MPDEREVKVIPPPQKTELPKPEPVITEFKGGVPRMENPPPPPSQQAPESDG